LFLISFITVTKLYDDYAIPMSVYSDLGGIAIHDLFNLESKFLELINYKLYIAEGDFVNYTNRLGTFYNKRGCLGVGTGAIQKV
jgi:hypothetical protein